MPGCKPLFDESANPILLIDHPEDVQLWPPSALPPESCRTWCVEDLPQIEYRLRLAQAGDALHDIRHLRRLIRAILTKTQAHIANTQRTSSRTRSLLDKVQSKQARAVSAYRVARAAIGKLAPNEEFGLWKKTLLELKDCDIRGPGREAYEPSESRHVQSWIWMAVPQTSTSTSTSSDDIACALQVEWCKGQERAQRYEEEVQLVVEEMRRTLAYFEWDMREWKAFGSNPPDVPAADAQTQVGVSSYAFKQADIRRRLMETCLGDWFNILEVHSLGSSWLRRFPRPPDNKCHRLLSNVKLYHSTPSVPDPTSSLPCVHTIPSKI